MAKILELESSVNPNEKQNVPAMSPEEMKKQNFENRINKILRKSYILGVSNGVRAAFIDILLEINKCNKMNAAKKLLHIKSMCEKRIDELKCLEASESTSTNGMKMEGENNEA